MTGLKSRRCMLLDGCVQKWSPRKAPTKGRQHYRSIAFARAMVLGGLVQAISTGPLRCPVRSIVQEFYGSAVVNFIT